MKTTIRLQLCAMALALAASYPLSRAQDNSAPPPPPAGDVKPDGARPPRGNPGKHMLDNLKAKLSLTADQVTKVEAILKDQMTQGQAIRKDESLSREDRHAKMQAVGKATHDQIRALLTADQQKIFDTMPAGPRPGGHKPRGEDAPPPPPPPPSEQS